MATQESILEEGKLEMQTMAVRNMLRANKLTVQEIAEYVGMSVAFVQEIQRQLPN